MLYQLFLIAPPVLLILMVLMPNRLANSSVRSFRVFVTRLAAFQFFASIGLLISHVAGILPDVHWVMFDPSGDASVAATLYYDGVSSLMFSLVSFVGWVICQYSIQYLDGETTQGRYFRWTAFAIGSVSLMVLSGNFVMFMISWVMTSTALHKLLLHYAHRPAAQRAAWSKFTISRMGDVSLLAAIVLIYSQFKTLDFVQLFEAIPSVDAASIPTLSVAAFLLVAGAITKSAQFPFHTWLPLTMETPTPVSALMHAGIVNAGGYLIIRTSPLIVISPAAMATLAIIGGFTALFAAVVMTTQTSVKKKLAYSTIAQMGFMLLQCGLGAFSAAMLHILAHSLYKAHAFLSSGNVMNERAAMSGALPVKQSASWVKLASCFALIAAMLGLSFLVFGINPLTKSGGLLLGGVICLALTHWVGQAILTKNRNLLIQSIAISGVLCFVYAASFIAVDQVIGSSIPYVSNVALNSIVAGILFLGFIGTFLLHLQLSSTKKPAWFNTLYIHASNGFYIENNLRRIIGNLSSN